MKEEKQKKFVQIQAKETLTQKELQQLIHGLSEINGFSFALMSHSKIET